MLYLGAFLLGLAVAIGTGLVIGGKKASKLPGGSLAAGLSIAFTTDSNAIVCAILGILGWAVYSFAYNRLNK